MGRWLIFSVMFAVQTPAGAEESSEAAEVLEFNQEEIWSDGCWRSWAVMLLSSLAFSDLYLQRNVSLISYGNLSIFLFWLCYLSSPGQEKREPFSQLSLKSFTEFSCQFRLQVNTRTHKILLFPLGCYCIVLNWGGPWSCCRKSSVP